jgi:tight adherence protein B
MSPALLTILVAVLGFITVAGLGWAVVGSDDSSAKAVKRAQGIVSRGAVGETSRARKSAQSAPDQRRRQLLKTLKEQERREKRARHSLVSRLQQAGMADKLRSFWIASAVLGVVVGLVVILLRQPWWAALVLSAGAGLGLPRWAIGMLGTRRVKAFTAAFPDAMDIITRGLRSGLPVHDCLKVIAKETPQPLCNEFQALVENIGVGLSMEQALERMYESMPSAEVRFFSIVLSIQAKSGGNLAEALGNLSTVIRARKMMREKIKAMASEAIASASIIGVLPPGVIALISFTSPAYMVPLFTDPRGNLMLAGGAIWMSAGIFVMRRMINFKI